MLIFSVAHALAVVMHVLKWAKIQWRFISANQFFPWHEPPIMPFFSSHIKSTSCYVVELLVWHLYAPSELQLFLKMATTSTCQCVYFIIMSLLACVCLPSHQSTGLVILGGSLFDGLAHSLSWSRRPVGTAQFSTPRPYVSNQSVSLAFNGTPATPASQAEHASTLSALTAEPSPCNWLLFYKARMLIW